MLLPNPLALAAVKVGAYATLGHLIARRNLPPNRGRPLLGPLGFGVFRVFLGWAFGIPLALVLTSALGEGASTLQFYLPFLLPRFVTWAGVIHLWYRPPGGIPSTLRWALVATALSTVLDLVFAELSEHIPIFQMGFC